MSLKVSFSSSWIMRIYYHRVSYTVFSPVSQDWALGKQIIYFKNHCSIELLNKNYNWDSFTDYNLQVITKSCDAEEELVLF